MQGQSKKPYYILSNPVPIEIPVNTDINFFNKIERERNKM